ncbi:MAG: hypothetical protein ACPGEG_08875 [Salibacteraceae bacterium]
MKNKKTVFTLLVILFAFSSIAQSKLIYKWEDDFSDKEKEKVTKWLEITFDAVQNRIGEYPFDVHLFIYRKEGKGEPCPWANTWRYPNQQVHFYIDPSYSLESFIADWTAPHEFSHLAIPYIGEEETWFSEGFASFMQYEVMNQMGLMTRVQCDSAYQSKLRAIVNDFSSEQTFAIEAMENKANHNYKAMYWGGATLFLQWNELLAKEGVSFIGLFPEYLNCCRRKSKGVDSVVKHLDEVSGFNFGANLLKQYREEPVNFEKLIKNM